MLDRLLNCRKEMNDLEKWGRYPNYLILSIHLNQYDDLFRNYTIILAQKLTKLEHFKENLSNFSKKLSQIQNINL